MIDERGLIDRLERAAMAYERLGNMKRDDEKTRQIRKDAIAELAAARSALITAYQSAKGAEGRKTAAYAEGDAYYFAVECWGAEWTKNEWESLVDFADLQARNRVVIEVVPSGVGGRPEP